MIVHVNIVATRDAILLEGVLSKTIGETVMEVQVDDHELETLTPDQRTAYADHLCREAVERYFKELSHVV